MYVENFITNHSVRVLKIGPHLPKLLSNIKWLTFIEHGVQVKFNLLESRGNYSATSNDTKLVHWPLMGGLLHLVQRGGTG